MNITTFSTYVVTSISLTVSTFIIHIWYRFFLQKNNTVNGLTEHETDYGLFFLSFALLTWGLSGILSLVVEYPLIIKYSFSSINSLFFLLAACYTEYAPKIISENKAFFKKIFTSACVASICITLSLNYFSSSDNLIKIPDFILSIPTVYILGYSLAKTFWKRGLSMISIFSIATLVLLLLAQPFINFFGNESETATLLALYSKLSFIVIICFLAFSWAQTRFKNALDNYRTVSNEVISLKEKVRIEREIAEKDERESAWQDVAFKAAHKFGNPLDAIDTYLQTAIKRLNDKDYKSTRNIMNLMDEAIEEAKNVLAEFKSLTRLLEMNYQRCDILKIISKIAHVFEEKNININVINRTPHYRPKLKIEKGTAVLGKFDLDEAIDIFLDRDKIKDCFNELFVNSTHFFDKDDKIITVEFEETQHDLPPTLDRDIRYLKIVYSDNGRGVAKEDKKRIFSPFFSTYQHGSGLGLSIVNRIIELHNGLIIENGEYLEGARFEIYLPIANNKI